MDRAVEHLGPERAGRYLRKFYPWYLERLGGGRSLQDALQRTTTVEEARTALLALRAFRPRTGPICMPKDVILTPKASRC